MTRASTTGRKVRPSGRRVGDSGTRDAILDSARDLFAERGFDGASIRAIATRARVDPALIRHFFGNKEALFAKTLADRTTLPQRLFESFDGDPAGIGERLTDAYFRLWQDPTTQPILMALVRSAVTSPLAADMLVDALEARIRSQEDVGRLDEERMRRIELAGAHLLGVAIARFVVTFPALAPLDHATLVAEVSPAIQRYLS